MFNCTLVAIQLMDEFQPICISGDTKCFFYENILLVIDNNDLFRRKNAAYTMEARKQSKCTNMTPELGVTKMTSQESLYGRAAPQTWTVI